jgi:protocatechuate 3,4-dioxygenase beta subunit
MNWFRFAFIALPVLVAAQQPGVVGSSSNQPQPPNSQPGNTQPTEPKDRCSIEGQVMNSLTGEPVRKAHVTLNGMGSPNSRGVAGPLTYGAVTDAGGRFTIQDIEPGSYFMVAERNGFTDGQSGRWGPGHSPTTVTLNPGQHTSDIVFRLVPHGVITGRVLDEDGEPVQNVQVNVLRYRFFRGKRQLVPSGGSGTDDLGEYRIFGLEPGKYYLSANYRRWNMMMAQDRTPGGAPEEGYAPTYFPGTTDPAGAVAIEVSAGAMLGGTDLTLRKIRTVRIRGRVANATGGGLPSHTMLRLMPRNSAFGGFFPQAFTEALRNRGGTFEFRGVAPGAYMVWPQWSDEGQGYSSMQPVDVGNNNLDDVTVLLSRGVELKGQVRSEGPGDVSLGNLVIGLEPKEMVQRRVVKTNDDGSFAIQNVPADHYWVNVYGFPPAYYLKSVRMGDADSLESGLDTTQGAAGTLEITIGGNGGQIEGSAADSKQKPASGAVVALVPDAPRRERLMLFKTAATDTTGHFSITGIAPGEYKLFAWEQIEEGAYQDPEFLKVYENQGQAVTIREGSRETAPLKVISVSDAPPKSMGN